MNNNWVVRTLFFVAPFFLLGSSGLLWYTAPRDGHFDLDSFNYDRIAWNFAQHGELIDPIDPHNPPLQPVGYSFLLGMTYSVERNPNIMVGMQVMSALACSGLILLLGLFLCNISVGLLSFIFTACNLGFLIYAHFILAEIVTVWLLLNAVLLFVLFLKKEEVLFLGGSGIFFGLSIWFKPVALMLCPFLVPLVFIKARSLVKIGLFIFSFYIIPLGIMTHNYYQYKVFALAPMNELNIYQVFLSKVVAHVENKSVEQVIQNQLAFTGKHAFDSNGWNDARNIFYMYLQHHPFVFIQVWLVNVSKTLFGLYTTQLKLLYHPELRGGDCSFFKQSGNALTRIKNYIEYGTHNSWLHLIGWIEFLFNIMRWLLILIGIGVLFIRKKYMTLYICMSWIIYFAMITGFDGCCRYRIFFEPMLIVLMARGLIVIIDYIKGYANEKSFITQRIL